MSTPSTGLNQAQVDAAAKQMTGRLMSAIANRPLQNKWCVSEPVSPLNVAAAAQAAAEINRVTYHSAEVHQSNGVVAVLVENLTDHPTL